MKYLFIPILLAIVILPELAEAAEFTLVDPITGRYVLKGGLIPTLVGQVVKALLVLTGVIAMLTFIRSGISIASARGNDEMVKKGRDGIIWAVIGLVVVFTGFIGVDFVIDQIQQSYDVGVAEEVIQQAEELPDEDE